MIRFSWDEAKNSSNQRKHDVSFEEAVQIFNDPLYVSVLDRIEEEEERRQTIGLVRGVLLLMAAHTVREEGTIEDVRIISARRATTKERRRYEDEND